MIILGPGVSHPLLPYVKAKLRVTERSDVYTDELAQKVRGWQKIRGREVTGLLESDELDMLVGRGCKPL